MNDYLTKLRSHKLMNDETVLDRIILAKPQTLTTVVAYDYKGLRVVAYPGRAP